MVYGMDITFNPDHAKSIIAHCEDIGMTEQESWLHLLAAVASLCPIKDMSLTTLGLVYDDSDDE